MNTIVAFHHPSKNNNLWVVSILENDSVRKYCRSAYSAMSGQGSGRPGCRTEDPAVS